MNKLDAKMDLPQIEKKILAFWQKEKIFEKTLELRKNAEIYSFYDGPPFATGTPHYGHIVASTIKDIIPRFYSMMGFNVPRVWGWDCHGLPIENIAEKELGIKNKKDIEAMGVDKFNEFCRSKVLEYTEEWKTVIKRLGRWADMDNAYKTMDKDYMESVWWVFKQLYDRGLIYEDYRSMHICPRCQTTLSQSEVAEGYREIKDLSLIAKFRDQSEEDLYYLAWTTTPWTLIGNVALAVGSEIEYVKISVKTEKGIEKYILAKSLLDKTFANEEYEILEEFKGKELVGKKYIPLIPYEYESWQNNISKEAQNGYQNFENGWRIVSAEFVSTDEGVGIVHVAPAYGEDDLNLSKKEKLPFVQHVSMDGIIKDGHGDFSGLSVKPVDDVQATDVEVIKYLAQKNLILKKEQYAHAYPHCWRCDTPLLNYATSSWFVNITKIKNQLLNNAEMIKWSPSHIKLGRFGKWLDGARDWSISRQRYWASVIPIWKCECGEIRVIGSVDELQSLCGCEVSDLHKHHLDQIEFSCNKCQEKMHRIPDVLDTWFDSGSMPYAQLHYPFEQNDYFEKTFPADFIGEGVDQTRAWFYYLHVISTAIFNKPAFKNVLVNGIVLALDGKKMSKRLQNYPDPALIFDKYGADVLRYYIASSPVVSAENLNFNEKEIAQLSRGVFRMIWNSFYFYQMYAEIDNWRGDFRKYNLSDNILDRWIISETENLNDKLINHMNEYDLLKSTRLFGDFIDNLSNWYIRRSRKRFWKSENDQDKEMAYSTLNYVLIKLSLLLAPFCPFISEFIFQSISGEESVHLCDYPKPNLNFIDNNLEDQMIRARSIIEDLLAIRDNQNIKVRQPLSTAQYQGKKLDEEIESIICDEVNIKKIMHSDSLTLGQKGLLASLDVNITKELEEEGIMRDFVRELQVLRKKLEFEITDRINVIVFTESEKIARSIQKFRNEITGEILGQEIIFSESKSDQLDREIKLSGQAVYLNISRIGLDA